MANTLWDWRHEMPAGREFEIHHRSEVDPALMPAFHVHDHYEFYLYLSGNIDMAVEEKFYTPQPYDLFIYPPGIMHHWVGKMPVGHYERAFFYISRSTLQRMSTPDFPIMQIIEDAMAQHAYCIRPGAQVGAGLLAQMDEIIRFSTLTAPADQLINRCRANILLASICRLINPEDQEALTIPNRMRDVISYINDHVTEPLTLDGLAEHFFVSKYYLLHAFKDYANLSVHQYIISKRIIRAQNLLRDGISPGDAARACGFNDYAGFYRAFVKQTGVAPQTFCKGGWHPAQKKEESHFSP